MTSLENLDILINNAGFGIMKQFLDIERQKHVEMINVHFTSPVMLTHAAIPIMKKRKRGVIINTSSRDAIIRDPTLIVYTTTKPAVSVFSELLQRILKGTGIYIQALHPGFTYTEFHDTSTMRGFNRESTSGEMWMTPKEVVSLSLNAVKTKKVIFIPGEKVQLAALKNRKMKIRKYSNCEII
jgi:short-subunit dehydrogenase